MWPCRCGRGRLAREMPSTAKSQQSVLSLQNWRVNGQMDTMTITQSGDQILACPFFMPVQKLDGAWLHPSRLPLGAGWDGHCSAPGHEGARPSDQELQEFCNLGYAAKCSRLPAERRLRCRPLLGCPRPRLPAAAVVCVRDRPSSRNPRHAGIRRGARPVDFIAF